MTKAPLSSLRGAPKRDEVIQKKTHNLLDFSNFAYAQIKKLRKLSNLLSVQILSLTVALEINL